ncbi:MAG: hypothetical protein JWQ57_3225 [Mucilaginibacter sp.]|nr:hypothetical protein [Mucilaginibacter sp.]
MERIEQLFGYNNGAKFSECGKHRLVLWRIWDDIKPLVMFIGLNPSTANATVDDPTIRRVRAMANSWGYGGVYMLNLFTFISTDPAKLNIEFGNHPDSDFYLEITADIVEKIVCAWGNFEVHGRDKKVKGMFNRVYALHINNNGSPKHPLYVKANTELINY